MLSRLEAALSTLSGWIWGPPLMVLLVGTGCFLTVRFGVIQLRAFRHAWAALLGKYDRKDDPGEISHFRALSAALSATIGTGNIVGVAAAIMMGGPGAVFWMWITAVVGMATKFASCTLAVHYRRLDERGEAHAGPMYYIEQGLGRRFKWLAVLFAVFTALASLGIGNMFQANNIAAAVDTLIYGSENPALTNVRLVTGITVSLLVALVTLGGIKRIAAFAARLVPFMCVLYTVGGILVLIRFAPQVPECFALIFKQAFSVPAAGGGLLGTVISAGVRRGLFSNEAGLGSAAMAHGAARTREPVREGLVAMLGPFIDTILICTLTALTIICTGVYQQDIAVGKLTGAAYQAAFPGGEVMVSLAVILFAFSTLISWSYYGDRATEYLLGPRAVPVYRWLYAGVVLIGTLLHLDIVITFSDIMNGCMAFPNLVALIVLSPVIARLAKDYISRMKKEQIY